MGCYIAIRVKHLITSTLLRSISCVSQHFQGVFHCRLVAVIAAWTYCLLGNKARYTYMQ